MTSLLILCLWTTLLCTALAVGCLYERWYLRRYGWPENYHDDLREGREDERPD